MKFNIFLIYLIFPISLMAYQVKNMPIEKLYDNAIFIGRVTLISVKRVKVDTLHDTFDCGYDYFVEVKSVYKGVKSFVSFRSNSQLLIGNDYLIFTNREYLDAKLKYLSMGKSDDAGYTSCSKGNTSFVNELSGEIMEFDSLRKILFGTDVLKTRTTNYSLLKSLNAQEIEYKNMERNLNNFYLDISYWLISWEQMEKKLAPIQSQSKGSPIH